MPGTSFLGHLAGVLIGYLCTCDSPKLACTWLPRSWQSSHESLRLRHETFECTAQAMGGTLGILPPSMYGKVVWAYLLIVVLFLSVAWIYSPSGELPTSAAMPSWMPTLPKLLSGAQSSTASDSSSSTANAASRFPGTGIVLGTGHIAPPPV